MIVNVGPIASPKRVSVFVDVRPFLSSPVSTIDRFVLYPPVVTSIEKKPSALKSTGASVRPITSTSKDKDATSDALVLFEP